MRGFGTISSLMETVALDCVRFEELPKRYASNPEEAYHEFTRRLQPLVFQAAYAFAKDRNLDVSQACLDDMTRRVFTEFVSEFCSGDPEMVLMRFAVAIERVLDRSAFQHISRRFYMHLPIYHVRDEWEKRMLAAAFQDGLRRGVAARLAARFAMSEERAVGMLQTANQSLSAVLARDAAYFKKATQGVL